MLRTDRLILRAARQDDLDALFAIYSDPRAMRFWSTAPHADRSVTQENLDRLIASAKAQLVYFVIQYGDRAIGVAGMHKPPEVGFLLHPDYWRQGFATEAMQAIIAHLWKVTDLPALTADADPRNIASVNCLKKMGFQVTGTAKNTFCINDEWSDSVYLALQRPQFGDNSRQNAR